MTPTDVIQTFLSLPVYMQILIYALVLFSVFAMYRLKDLLDPCEQYYQAFKKALDRELRKSLPTIPIYNDFDRGMGESIIKSYQQQLHDASGKTNPMEMTNRHIRCYVYLLKRASQLR